MNTRTHCLSILALVGLALSGCSAAVESSQTSDASGGAIEFAVAETCSEGSDPQCVPVDGQYIKSPAAFTPATVEIATVADVSAQNGVDVTFTDDGAAVLNSITVEAIQAGGKARLVMKVGDDMLAAVMVAAPLTGNSLTIVLSPDDNAQEVADLLNNN